MSFSPQLHTDRRIPRFRLTETTPAVLQFQNGLHISGELHVVSRNGGLLLLPELVHQGSVANLMFQTHRGLVWSTVELLTPVANTQQPFRFISLPEGDQRTLQTAFQSGLYRNIDEEERIEELRAAVARWNPPRNDDICQAGHGASCSHGMSCMRPLHSSASTLKYVDESAVPIVVKSPYHSKWSLGVSSRLSCSTIS